MKPESINSLGRLREYCNQLLSNPSADPAIGLAMMRVLLSRVQAAEASTIDDLDLTREEVEQMKSGFIIDAIKAVRIRTGVGLKEAKEIVERAGVKLGVRGPNGWTKFR